jgi:hypothetical protein
MMGEAFYGMVSDFTLFLTTTLNARTEKDFDEAARYLATGTAKVGVAAFSHLAGAAICGGLRKLPKTVRVYFNTKLKIDMRGAPAGSAKTMHGDPRNGPWFWRQMLEKHPEMFSEVNKIRIRKGTSPHIDEQWVQSNPTHKEFMDKKLIHHHIDQGPVATPLPEPIHQAHHGVLHPER